MINIEASLSSSKIIVATTLVVSKPILKPYKILLEFFKEIKNIFSQLKFQVSPNTTQSKDIKTFDM
jgi:hypothetical protein